VPAYLLTYEQPRIAPDGTGVIYETKRLKRDFADVAVAVRWARHTVPRECGMAHLGKKYLAAPIELWRIEPNGRSVIWETRPARRSGKLTKR